MTLVGGVRTDLSAVVVCELVTKRLRLLAPERFAARITRPMNLLSRVAGPLVLPLSLSSSLFAEAGVFHASEQAMVANLLRFDEQRIGSIITPRRYS